MSVVLKVSLHDNLGNEFSHSLQDVTSLGYKLSQKDDIQVNFGANFTVAVRENRSE